MKKYRGGMQSNPLENKRKRESIKYVVTLIATILFLFSISLLGLIFEPSGKQF